MFLVMLWACRTVETAEENVLQIRPDENDTVMEDTASEVLEDIDEDGYWSDVDCDDWNPNIYPGAPEILNNEDDDCDGYVDIDGQHRGMLQMQAVGIFEGQSYFFEQDCTGMIQRERGTVEMNLTCVIDQSQEKAALLLGGEIAVHALEHFIFENLGESQAAFSSVNGEMEWNAFGNAAWEWSSWEQDKGAQIQVSVILDAIYLDVQIEGILYRE